MRESGDGDRAACGLASAMLEYDATFPPRIVEQYYLCKDLQGK